MTITMHAFAELILAITLIRSPAATSALTGAETRRVPSQSTNALCHVTNLEIVNKKIAPDGFTCS